MHGLVEFAVPGADERKVPLTFMPGKGVLGKDFSAEMNVPPDAIPIHHT